MQPTETTADRRPTLPSISLPKGGGAVRGIGEKFAANPVTGTGSMSVPIASSPGRGGFGPQLALSYDSGAGNGPFGLGWTLALPSVTRKTDRGLPRYDDRHDSDVYLLSGSEDLVPVLTPDGVRHEDTTTDPDFLIHRYRPRIEGLFARIERWTRRADGDVHWRSISADNTLSVYGQGPDARIADPADRGRIFSWLICESRDDKGNAMVYEYRAEDGAGVPTSRAHQRNRGQPNDPQRSANRYIKRIRYGNRVPLLAADGRRPHVIEGSEVQAAEWMFELVFDYGEHDDHAPHPDDASPWRYRVDPFSSYRAGFEVRTTRLCRRVLMYHHFPAEPGVGRDCLVRSTDFTYSDEIERVAADDPVYTCLRAVTHHGYARDGDGYLQRSLPPLELTYSKPAVQDRVEEVDLDSVVNLPAGVDGTKVQWADLHGEGVPGALTEQADGWFYKRNLSPLTVGGASLGPVEQVALKPTASLGRGAQLMDLAGDGLPDVVVLDGNQPGYYEHDEGDGWQPFRPFTSRLHRELRGDGVKLIDLDGDGHHDVLVGEDGAWVWHASRAEAGFGPGQRLAQAADEERGPRLVFSDVGSSVYLADMSGDGLTDLVRIRNGEVCYWPNLGYGRFGARISMDDSPWFDRPEQFEQRRVRLADLDGSGTSDIVYLHRDGVRLYFNQSGNGWSAARVLHVSPRVDDVSTIAATDLLGNGTACLVWSSPLPADARRPMRYVSLMGAEKPHLLVRAVNNLGAETRVHYAPSTRFYLQDRREGRPWVTRLPFPVHVVERVESIDHISRSRFVSRYAYHHGYFDGPEREFRGFGMVEQFDTESFAALRNGGEVPDEAVSHVPPVLTRSWYHTGAMLDRERISRQYEHEYYRPQASGDGVGESLLLPDTILPGGLNAQEERLACRALKGSLLRQEVYGLDDGPQAAHPYTVVEHSYAVARLQPAGGHGDAVFITHPREVLTAHHERDPVDPRVEHALTLEVDDVGNVCRALSVAYGRRTADTTLDVADQARQAATLITYAERDHTNAIDTAETHRTPLAWSNRTYELTGFAPEPGASRFRVEDWTTDDFAVLAAADELTFEQTANGDTPQKRLIEHACTLYRSDDLRTLLPAGHVDPLAISGESYTLAFTPGLLTQVLQQDGQPLLPDPAGVLGATGADGGGYVDLRADGTWWIPSGRTFLSAGRSDGPAEELAHARQHFFLPHRLRDVFGNESSVTYDGPADGGGSAYDLFVASARDAVGNAITARFDYRVLQARLVTDANGNEAAAAFDALGMVAGTAVMGSPGSTEGDTLEGFRPDLSDAEVSAHLADPLATGAAVLAGASARLVYDVFAYRRTGAGPAAVSTVARESHGSGPGTSQARLQHSVAYSDGLGREIQVKAQAEQGPVPQRGPDGGLVIGADGRPVPTDDEHHPRWVGTGWTVFNNKGKPVRQYEPFFSDRHDFEFDVRIGVSPVVLYDPLGRAAATVRPDHAWEKVTVDAWREERWDVNDTVLISDPRADPAVGDLFRSLPEEVFLPTWHEQRAAGGLGAQAQDAARKAAAHAATPAVSHADPLGRAIVHVLHNRMPASASGPAEEERQVSRVTLDIEGNRLEVVDALGRVVLRDAYDVAGRRVHQHSLDAGARWMLVDAGGKTIRSWDERGHSLRVEHDALRRPLRSFVTGADPDDLLRELLTERRVYGEQHPQAVAANLRGRLHLVLDQAGAVRTETYDVKGNPVASSRRLARDYRRAIDWRSVDAALPADPVTPFEPGALELSLGPLLEAELFSTLTSYDALDRPTVLTLPDGSQVRPTYNEAKLLERVDVQVRGAEAATAFVTDIDYDAKGQRQRISYGNGVVTRLAHDPLTMRLVNLRTTRGGEALQDLTYTHDPGGNITHVRDGATQTSFFRNRRVEPDGDYTYDAVYRLIEARGREHLGQVSGSPIAHDVADAQRTALAHPGDGAAMGTYLERYAYDLVGNLVELQHRGSDPSHPGWTRAYRYDESSPLDPATRSNRLSGTSLGDDEEVYRYDAHGNVTHMPHLPQLRWDHRDQLHATSRQVVGDGSPETTYYVYDAAGERVRKVTERSAAPGQVPSRAAERLYLNGFELHRRYAADGTTVTVARETVHVMDDAQRIALVETRTVGTDPAPEQLVRYQLGNHLGSASLELDDVAQIISYEEYTPFGSTSYQATRGQTETAKRYRFTGKERDEQSGLYYHGARYYAPWLGRWTACDPAILATGSGVRADQSYVYVENRPIVAADPDGRIVWPAVIGAVIVTGLTVVSAANAPTSKADAAKAEPSVPYLRTAAHAAVNTVAGLLGTSLLSGVKSKVLSWAGQGAVGGGSGAVLGKAVDDIATGHTSKPMEYVTAGVVGTVAGGAAGVATGAAGVVARGGATAAKSAARSAARSTVRAVKALTTPRQAPPDVPLTFAQELDRIPVTSAFGSSSDSAGTYSVFAMVKGQRTTKVSWPEQVRFLRGYLQQREFARLDYWDGTSVMKEGGPSHVFIPSDIRMKASIHNHPSGYGMPSTGDLVTYHDGGFHPFSEHSAMGFKWWNANKVLASEGLRPDWTVVKTSVKVNEITLDNIYKVQAFLPENQVHLDLSPVAPRKP